MYAVHPFMHDRVSIHAFIIDIIYVHLLLTKACIKC